jgi:hypothetical protein
VLFGGVVAISNMPDSTPTGGGHASPASAEVTPRVASDGESPRTAPRDAPNLDFPLDGPEWKELDATAFPGLKYWDVTEGSGAVCPNLKAKPNLIPVMHYTGWLTNGSRFDSSLPKGEALTYPLFKLVRGWQEGVPGMKVGGKRRLIIPGQWGYGPQGQGTAIPPNATLVFEMELIGIK